MSRGIMKCFVFGFFMSQHVHRTLHNMSNETKLCLFRVYVGDEQLHSSVGIMINH